MSKDWSKEKQCADVATRTNRIVLVTAIQKVVLMTECKQYCECDNPDFFKGVHERQTCGNCGGLV